MITATAPARIDLAGGTLDIWPLFLFQEPTITINVAVSLFATAKVESIAGTRVEIISHDQNETFHEDQLSKINSEGKLPLLARLVRFFAPAAGFRLETKSAVPAGSGLGGSSALAIAVCGALNEYTGAKYSYEDLIGIARDIEAQVLGIPTGLQDYYAAMYGGLSGWQFGVNKIDRHTYLLPLTELESRLVLLYSGLPRNSGINNWQVFKNRIDRDQATVEQLAAIHQEAQKLHYALLSGNLEKAAAAIQKEWEARKKLAPSITTNEIDEIIDFGMSQGALAGRVCGAGGGGCLILIARPGMRNRLESLAREKNFKVLEFSLVNQGLQIQQTS
jgi:D-glycero-alpha-D-manno-heptose-7-phosphate kinase